MGISDKIFGFGKLKQSEREFKEELKRDPEDAIAHYNLGIVYSKLGRLNDAIEEYKLAIEYGTKYKANHGFLARAWFDLGVDYQQKEMIDRAITAYEKSLHYDPHYIQARINLDLIKQLLKPKSYLRINKDYHDMGEKVVMELRTGFEDWKNKNDGRVVVIPHHGDLRCPSCNSLHILLYTDRGQEYGDAIYMKCKVCDYSDYSDKDTLSDYIENDPTKYVNLEKYYMIEIGSDKHENI